MTHLVDTDWVIQPLAGRTQAATTLRRLVTQRIAVSVITLGEVYEGAFTSSNPQAHLSGFPQMLASYRVLPVTEPISEHFAEIRSIFAVEERSSLPSIFLSPQSHSTMI